MLNFNGSLLAEESVSISHENRAFKFGDGIFETIKVVNNKVIFWEDHYFRLMASMRMLRMKIPMSFTLEYLQEEILKTVNVFQSNSTFRVRLNVYRKDGGLYLPSSNEIDYLIEVKPIQIQEKETYKLDIFKDFYVYSGMLSTVKTNNRMINTLASIYADENDLDNCVLINEKKSVVEVANGNIFIVKGNTVKTPSLDEGCIKGIIRKKVIDIINENNDYTLEEGSFSPFEIQKADEVFITNAIIGIQSVTHYKKKEFKVEFSKKIQQNFKVLEFTSA